MTKHSPTTVINSRSISDDIDAYVLSARVQEVQIPLWLWKIFAQQRSA